MLWVGFEQSGRFGRVVTTALKPRCLTLCCASLLSFSLMVHGSDLQYAEPHQAALVATKTQEQPLNSLNNNDTSPCAIDGKAEDWALDACLWEMETDDTEDPGVIECQAKAQQQIRELGSCDAKQLFKFAICSKTAQWQMQNNCLENAGPMGPTLEAAFHQHGSEF
jgi:hypothetical protein